ncbi:hypothetical protein AB5A11_003495 [Vibrio cholerae]
MELIKGYLAPFLTVLGWGIVLYNADRIALRNESRSSIDGCIKKLEELITLTQEFMHEVDKTSSKKYQYEGKVAALCIFRSIPISHFGIIRSPISV